MTHPSSKLWSRLTSALLLLAAPAALAEDSVAPGFSLSRFEPSGRGSRFFTLESLDWRSGSAPTLGLVGDYAYKPLVIYRVSPEGHQEVLSVAHDMGLAHLGGTYAIGDAFRVGVDLPVLGYGYGRAGQIGLVSYDPPLRSGVGDLRLSGDWRFFGGAFDSVRAGLGVSLYAPTGDPAAFMGDGALRGSLQLQAAGDVSNYLSWSARVGVLLSGLETQYAGGQVGSEAQGALAVGVRALDGRLIAGPELSAATTLKNAFDGQSTAVDLLIGAHYAVSPQWNVGLGVGRGLTAAFGEPAVRGVLSVEWAPQLGETNSCEDLKAQLAAQEKAAADARADAERIAAEQKAAEQLAAQKRAEEAAEQKRLAEEKAAALARAAADDDGDGIANGEDRCPDKAGIRSAEASKSGCPNGYVVGDQLVLDLVRFKTGSDVILPASDALLQKVLEAINALPADYHYRIEGHTDDRGSAALNNDLSQRRAKSVVAWLVKHGMDRKRLEAAGFGAARPVASNDTEDDRQKNRRVEIHITNLEAR